MPHNQARAEDIVNDEVPRFRKRRDEDREEDAWTVFNPSDLEEKEVPQRNWIVDDWLPMLTTTALYADGGIGKTLLALTLQIACDAGRPWCGLAVKPCRSIALYCEDDQDELHRRSAKICDLFGVRFSELQGMRWISGVGQDNALAEHDGEGRMRKTSRMMQLENLIEHHKAELVILDTAADLFIGNENDRQHVRQFIGMLNGLALQHGCAVLLNAHPSRTGLATGNIDGGSTAWSNTVRSRWSLARPQADGEGDGGPDTDERILTRRKANYASVGDTIKLRWQNGVLVPTTPPGRFAAMAAANDADAVFLALLARVTAEGRPVSDSCHSSNPAPKLFAQRPDRQGFGKRDFEAAMQRLFAAGKIRMEAYGRDKGKGLPRRIVATEGGADA